MGRSHEQQPPSVTDSAIVERMCSHFRGHVLLFLRVSWHIQWSQKVLDEVKMFIECIKSTP